ncbi:MAG: hypothetical protein IIB83_02900 [Bacteroidetes bacterium]|nr:hypothetical protein [Bacteroidota bacterium]
MKKRLNRKVLNFSKDKAWMNNTIILTKHTLVWLNQLSEKYNKVIKRLDQIPNEELKEIASRNFNALWLIGIWERSKASKRIKELTGNFNCVSSAYSIYDYKIAENLGGQKALLNLSKRAEIFGIKLACDFVPNHTGITSDLLFKHPDYFIQTETLPFNNYSFAGKNLSSNKDYGIKIEDGYYSRKDAAVVFQFKEKKTGKIRYIYHGNDGTNMPWNDTAQLDLTKAKVRRALINQIKKIGRLFPIVRIDAAMMLTKYHFARLWYPKTFESSSVPSRYMEILEEKDFNKKYPNEFWKDLTDEIKKSKKDIFLFAETYWMTEWYFIKELGMNRVYNSAFMNNLLQEKNEDYHQMIKDILNENPNILKRFVNYLSNPDEEPVIDKFGKGDKYLGITVMMLTLPGLPLFAHGQIEGFYEKYGMEYDKPRDNEIVDEGFLNRHKYEIFPLMKMRKLFSGVKNFEYFSSILKNGKFERNVFAYTNKYGRNKALVIYNNKLDKTNFTLQVSYSKINKDGTFVFTSITKALDMKNSKKYFYIYEDFKTKLQYIISGIDAHKHGLSFKLKGYEYKISLRYKEVFDSEGLYKKIFKKLKGKGVSSISKFIEENIK